MMEPYTGKFADAALTQTFYIIQLFHFIIVNLFQKVIDKIVVYIAKVVFLCYFYPKFPALLSSIFLFTERIHTEYEEKSGNTLSAQAVHAVQRF